MKILNTTPDIAPCKHNGNNYYLQPNESVTVSSVIGSHLLERFRAYGIVDITLDPENLNDGKNFLVKRIMEGLTNYLDTLYSRAEGFLKFDEELKEKNIHATILRHKLYRQCEKDIITITAMLGEFEDRFGFTLRKDELEKKKTNLFETVELLMKEFDADKEANVKATEYERDVKSILDDVMKIKTEVKKTKTVN